jgi:hypothetical protein
MKCEDHPFYPRRYCMGCTFKKQECALCGIAMPTSGGCEIDVQEGDAPGKLQVCENCLKRLAVIKSDEEIRSYTGSYSIRLNKDRTRYERIGLEERG